MGDVWKSGVLDMSVKHIDIGVDFSTRVGPRYRTDGKFSGEEFREDFLEPAIKGYDTVVVHLDSLLGYGASFLEEAFGGLVRLHGINFVSARMQLVSATRPYLLDRIRRYMVDAEVSYVGVPRK